MARSKSGGTRAYIRGRVGSDVYSIGKTAKGKKQQVVRSLAETVANPQTTAQMRGRMIMSTIMQAVSALSPIIDHSFDGLPKGQPSISEFISRNYALIKADVAAHPASGNAFGLNKYQEKGAKYGAYVVSNGDAIVPVALAYTTNHGSLEITLSADTMTVGGLKAALGMTTDDYFTVVGIGSDGQGYYVRFRINPTLADTTALTSDLDETLFVQEGNDASLVMIGTTKITINIPDHAHHNALIVSYKTGEGYKHNTAVMAGSDTPVYTADVALPTYPTGSENFLNGGDIF